MPHIDDLAQHQKVLDEAFDIFTDRSASRGDMWRHFPIRDKVRELRERVARIEMAINMIPYTPPGREPDRHLTAMRGEIRADAIDMINYAAFLIKQIDEGADL